MTIPTLSPATLTAVLTDFVLQDAPSTAIALLVHPSLTPDQIAGAWCEYKDALTAIARLGDGSAHPEDYIGSTAAPAAVADTATPAAVEHKRMEAGAALRTLLHGTGGN